MLGCFGGIVLVLFVFVCRSSLPASKLIGEISVAPQGFVTELAWVTELPGLFASIRNAMLAASCTCQLPETITAADSLDKFIASYWNVTAAVKVRISQEWLSSEAGWGMGRLGSTVVILCHFWMCANDFSWCGCKRCYKWLLWAGLAAFACKVGECLLKGDVSYLDLPRKRVASRTDGKKPTKNHWVGDQTTCFAISIALSSSLRAQGRGRLFITEHCQRNACWSPQAQCINYHKLLACSFKHRCLDNLFFDVFCRSTIIGESVRRVLEFCGHEVHGPILNINLESGWIIMNHFESISLFVCLPNLSYPFLSSLSPIYLSILSILSILYLSLSYLSYPIYLILSISYLSIYLSFFLSFPSFLSFFLYYPIYLLSNYLSIIIYLSIYLSVHPSIHLLIYRYIDLSICRSIDLWIYGCMDLSIYRSIDLSIYRSLDLSIYWSISIHLSIDLSIFLSIHQSNLV